MGQSRTESRIREDLIWELAPLVMLIVALCFLYLGGWRREGSLGSVQEQEALLWQSWAKPVVSKVGCIW